VRGGGEGRGLAADCLPGGGSVSSCWPLGACCTSGSSRPLRSGIPRRTLGALRALGACCSGVALETLRPLLALGADGPLRTDWPLDSLQSCGSGRSGIPFQPLLALIPLITLQTRCARGEFYLEDGGGGYDFDLDFSHEEKVKSGKWKVETKRPR